MIDRIIDYNKTFVEQKGYEKYLTRPSRHPYGLQTIIYHRYRLSRRTARSQAPRCLEGEVH